LKIENNPFEEPPIEAENITAAEISSGLDLRIFIYSILTSIAVVLTVVSIWLAIMFSKQPLDLSRLAPLSELATFFMFFAMPYFATCLCFTGFYCSKVPQKKNRKIWPGMLFGALSGLIFNACTAITVIEQLFDW